MLNETELSLHLTGMNEIDVEDLKYNTEYLNYEEN